MRWKNKLTNYQRNAVQHHLQAFGKEFLMIFGMTIIMTNFMFYLSLLWNYILDWLAGIQPFGYISALLFLLPITLTLPFLYINGIHRQLKKSVVHCYTKRIRVALTAARVCQDISGFLLGVGTAYLLFPYAIEVYRVVGLMLIAAAIHWMWQIWMHTTKQRK